MRGIIAFVVGAAAAGLGYYVTTRKEFYTDDTHWLFIEEAEGIGLDDVVKGLVVFTIGFGAANLIRKLGVPAQIPAPLGK